MVCGQTVWQTAGNLWCSEGFWAKLLLLFSGFRKASLGCSGGEGSSLQTSEFWGGWERGKRYSKWLFRASANFIQRDYGH